MQIIRTIAGILVGLIIGSIANMGLILTGAAVVPPPQGVDPSQAESIAASIHLFELKHFIFPFLAHAIGTLVGATIAYLLSSEHKIVSAYTVGCLFLLGGITTAFMIPAPIWFISFDLVFGYIPMAFLAIKIGLSITPQKGSKANN